MIESNSNFSKVNNQRNENNTIKGGRCQERGRGICGRGGRGHEINEGGYYTRHNNRNKVQIKELGKNDFEVVKSKTIW